MLNDESTIKRLVNSLFALQSKENANLPLLQKQLADTEKSIENMVNAIQDGIYTKSTKQRLDQLEETKESLEISILQEQIEKPTLTKEQIKDWITGWQKVDIEIPEQRQKLIDIFLNSVYHYDDKLIISWNGKEGVETLSLSDVNGSTLEQSTAPTLMAFVSLRSKVKRIGVCSGSTIYKLGAANFRIVESLQSSVRGPRKCLHFWGKGGAMEHVSFCELVGKTNEA